MKNKHLYLPLLGALALGGAACASQERSAGERRPREVRFTEDRFNLNAALTEGRIHNNKDGCQLTNLEPNGYYAKLGILEGDTITKLNQEEGVVDCLRYFNALDKKILTKITGRDSAGNPFEIKYLY